jgi:hypothetical protein
MIAEQLSQAGAGKVDLAVAFIGAVLLALIHSINLKEFLEIALVFFELILVLWRISLLWADWADRKRRRSQIKNLATEVLEEEP